MRNIVLFLIGLGLIGCRAGPPPSSICETTPEMRLDDQIVEWSGVVVNASPHGIFFAGECGHARAMPIISLPASKNADRLNSLLQSTRNQPGALKVKLVARLVNRRGLEVQGVDEFHFVAMSRGEAKTFWKNTMGMPGIGGSSDVR